MDNQKVEIKKKISANPIKWARIDLKKTQIEVAKELSDIFNKNFQQRDISRWEQSKHKPGRDIIKALSKILKQDYLSFSDKVDAHFEGERHLKELRKRKRSEYAS